MNHQKNTQNDLQGERVSSSTIPLQTPCGLFSLGSHLIQATAIRNSFWWARGIWQQADEVHGLLWEPKLGKEM